jgi:hypothetical protein
MGGGHGVLRLYTEVTLQYMLTLYANSIYLHGQVVPETIPAGYHGHFNDQVQDVPEWPAFDFGPAYLLCRGACYVLSFQAKSAPRLVYLMVQAQPRGGLSFRLSGHCYLGQTPIRNVHLRDGAHQTFVRLGTAISSRWVRSDGVPFVRLPLFNRPPLGANRTILAKS